MMEKLYLSILLLDQQYLTYKFLIMIIKEKDSNSQWFSP